MTPSPFVGQIVRHGLDIAGIADGGNPCVRPGVLVNVNNINLCINILRVIIDADAVQKDFHDRHRACRHRPATSSKVAKLDVLAAAGEGQRHTADVAPFNVGIVQDA